MKLANIGESPYFTKVADWGAWGDYEVNDEHLHAEHGENAVLEFDSGEVLRIDCDENDFTIRMYGGRCVTVDPETELKFEVAVRERRVLDSF